MSVTPPDHTDQETGLERTYQGLGVSRGIAIGFTYVYTRDELRVDQRTLEQDEVEKEIERFEAAVKKALKELKKIASLAQEKLGNQSAGIFEAQSLMLQDESFLTICRKFYTYEPFQCQPRNKVIHFDQSKSHGGKWQRLFPGAS